ncbi:HAD family hydrolase [Qipengyuania qiaonensis]|uniref:HAD family hydrolase n=1 Tax=Qipengyuania qiaonensis TaxID=2867240 RepID=A0ABS7J7T3_9SPHN|nr:HAD family hydrolase [Qipengyuania qiaonensis]MBX7483385.1 HAD family hydrolase [Qipengyuania qiaonensis]
MTMPFSSSSTVVRVLVFDLDDTLYLERDFAFSGFAAVERHLRVLHGDAVVPGTCRTLFEHGVRGEIFNRALERFGIASDANTIATLVEVYRGHTPRIRPCPDTARFLSADSRRRAIITDGPAAMQRAKIDALGIADQFDLVIPTGELPHGMGKPHPRAFEQVMAWSGETGAAHVYIADNPMKDFIAPRALGWRTVQIDRVGRVHSPEPQSSDHAAEMRIGSLDELASVLATAG